jgi:hypothetical protein
MTSQDRALFGIEKLNVVRSEIPAVNHIDMERSKARGVGLAERDVDAPLLHIA